MKALEVRVPTKLWRQCDWVLEPALARLYVTLRVHGSLKGFFKGSFKGSYKNSTKALGFRIKGSMYLNSMYIGRKIVPL